MDEYQNKGEETLGK